MEHIKVKLGELFPESQWEVSPAGIGASKQAFIAKSENRTAFVKTNINARPLKRLAELGVAPPLLYDGSENSQPFVVQEFLTGESPDASWFNQNIEHLAHFIKKYHQDQELKSLVVGEKEQSYEENIEEVLKGLDKDIAESNSELMPSEEVSEIVADLKKKKHELSPMQLVPTHSDPNPQNLLITNRGLVMIDWDDIFLSDPMKDIALILWWYIPRNKWPTFFENYGEEMDSEKIQWWIARNTLSIAGWYGKQGNQEYVKFFVDDAKFALEGKDNSQIFDSNN